MMSASRKRKSSSREDSDDEGEFDDFEEQRDELSHHEEEDVVADKAISKKEKTEEKKKKKKKKKKKMVLAEPTDARGKIHYLLQINCRPYGLCQIIDETQTDKGVALAMLDQLERNDLVASKTIGNQKFFWSVEHQACSIDELESQRKAAADYNTQTSEVEKEVSLTSKKTRILSAEPTNNELEDKLNEAQAALDAIRAKFDTATARGSVTKPQMEKAIKEHNEMLKNWTKRKIACREIVEDLSENFEISTKKFIQNIEDFAAYETDEEFSKVPLPPPKPIPLAPSKKINFSVLRRK